MTNQGMKDLISLINRLQDAATTAGLSFGELDLPQIAVVGGQSAGKSSVLENFVGRDFLPRGAGIVTRRPLVLQLHPSKEEFAEFLHIEGKRFTDFELVREEIQKETDRLTGTGKGISRVPINLRIYSPNVLELTLVDLPGMTRVPVGDQPPDIEDQIRSMILEYIVSDNTLILAVSPANQDIANSDALKLGHLVDPEGERTIGVLTKLDLMDKGTDAKNILENNVYRLKRGFVGLVNRSQQDINSGKNIVDSQKDEMDYFYSNDSYRDIADRMGSKYLQYILNKELSEHIRRKLPKLSGNIKKKHAAVKAELIKMNAFNEGSDSGKQLELVKLMQNFYDDLNTDLTGYSLNVGEEKLSTGAKINACFYKDIYNILHQVACPNEKELEIIIQNLHGFRNGHFVCGLSLEIVIRKLVEKYRDPIDISVDLISALLVSSVKECSMKLKNFPKLKEVVIEIISERIKTQEDQTKKQLKMYVDAQRAFINTKHPYFNQPHSAGNLEVNESLHKDASGPVTEQNRSSSGAKILHKGWISICGLNATWFQACWFVLTAESLMWYTSEDISKQETKLLGAIPIQELDITKHPQYKGFILSRNGIEPMIIFSQNDEDLSRWRIAWNRIGITIKGLPQNNQKDTESMDPSQKDRKLIIEMINSYMKIVDNNIFDITPKYIILLLIESILNFTRLSLLHEIINREDWLDLMDESSEEVEKKKKLMVAYEASKKALEILREVSFS